MNSKIKTYKDIIWDVINSKDNAYQFSGLGLPYDMTGDDPYTFMDSVLEEYFQNLTFEQVTSFVMEWLNKNGHPHMIVVIDPTNAQHYESQKSFNSQEHVRD